MIRAIFFDLDDTLVDTSGQLVGPAHRDAAEAMVRAGLPGAVDHWWRRRMEIACGDPTADVDAVVAAEAGCGAHVVAAGRRVFFERRIDALEPFPGAVPALRILGSGRHLVLVTAGHEATQQRKITLCALDGWFQRVVILPPDRPDKGAVFAAELERLGVRPGECCVVGDRLDREIAAGRALGMWTVRMAHGEGSFARPMGPGQQPDYSVATPEGVVAAVRDIETIDRDGLGPLFDGD